LTSTRSIRPFTGDAAVFFSAGIKVMAWFSPSRA
jgi:hypothetical protein